MGQPITLPNGNVLNDVPDGITRDQAKQKAIQLGLASEEDFVMAEPESGMPDAGAIGNPLLEFSSGVNRGVGDLVDFWTTDPINVVTQRGINPALDAMGIDFEIPRIEGARQALDDVGWTSEGYMDEGVAKDIVGRAGEIAPSAVNIGGALRTGAKMLPKMVDAGESVATGVIRQMGQSTAAGDVAYGALSEAGAKGGETVGRWGFGEGGEEIGKAVGAIISPVIGASMKKPLTYLLSKGWGGVKAFLANAPKTMSEDGLATLLSEAMVREGITPEQAIAKLASMGEKGVPADIGNNFSRLLRLASNKIPRVQGVAYESLNARQAGSGDRVLRAMDDATGTSGLTMDDEIARIDSVMSPKIKQLYEATREQGMPMSEKLRTWFTGSKENKNAIYLAQKEVQKRLANMRSLGENPTNIDIINQTKQVLDDQIGKAIRAGENNRVRMLTKMKNEMVAEADSAIPTYKAARNLFAGKASLEQAGDHGTQYMKLKPRDIDALTATMTESEKRMFKLGAKQALMDKIDQTDMNADMIKRMFGKSGDIKKLRSLFDDEDSFLRFEKAMKREARMAMTRRAIEGNSTTTQQLSDEKSWAEHYTDVSRAMSNPRDAGELLSRILNGLSKSKGDGEYIKSLEKAGYLLAQTDMDATKLYNLLKRGNDIDIGNRVKDALVDQIIKRPYVAGTVAGQVQQDGQNAAPQ